MDASIFPGINLLIKYLNEDITSDELRLLHKYMEESSVLKEKFEEFSSPDKVKERIRLQYNFDKETSWQKFKSKHVVDDIPETVVKETSVKINWSLTLISVAAVVLIVGAITYSIVNIVGRNQSDMVDEKSESELNLFVQEKLPAKFASGYLDLADKGRFELEKIPAGRIDLPGSSIFSQGALFTITNNNIESKKPSAIKIMTAEKQIKLQLPDGSRVTLNKNSFISFPSPFDPEQRMVSLKGEALFEVESNPNAPFVVQLINKAKVQAYGTVFTVNCYGKDSYTTLLRGHVTVTTDGQTKTLWEGEQVKITEGVQGFSVEKANPEKAISWTCKSEFELKNVGFKQMMLEIGRWFGYPVSFQGEMPHGNHKIKLNEDTSLDFLIETIEENDKVTIQKTTDNKLIVMSK